MESELLQVAVTQGMWATLAVGLILYTIKYQERRDLKQNEREEKYQSTIFNLSDSLKVLNEIKEELKSLKRE